MSTLYLTRNGSPAQGIAALVMHKPKLVIVIPSYDENHLIKTLESVKESCTEGNIVILPIINYADDDSNEVKSKSDLTFKKVTDWGLKQTNKLIQILPIIVEFPSKKAGVGAARKLGMDEAVRIYEQFDSDGIIVNLDADCQVSKNYVEGLAIHFERNEKSPAASIYYEHSIIDLKEDQAIINYEIHLRYFVEMQRFCSLPYAYQTVGSSMAVRSKAYQKQGGMNKRKAGEDFYFLQKMMLLGHFSEINDICVYPSSRISERVPFGTGRAMLEWKEGNQKIKKSYHPQSFVILKAFLDLIPELFIDRLEVHKNKIPIPVWQFLESMGFHKTLAEIKKKSPSLSVFQRHFYSWLDGFVLMKFVHFSRDNFYPNESLTYCMKWLFENIHKQNSPESLLDALILLRKFDNKGNYNLGFHSY